MTANVIQFFAPGEPKGQPRPRAVSINGSIRMYTPSIVKPWRTSIKVAAINAGIMPARPIAGPISVNLGFVFERPKSHFRSGKYSHELKPGTIEDHIKKPDVDNLSKAVLDVLTELKFWHDDSQVTSLLSSKNFGDNQGCQISISEIIK